MTEVDIIKKIGFENESIPFDSLLTGNLKVDSETKSAVIALLSNGVLKSKVEKSTLRIVLKIGNVDKAKSMLKVFDLSVQLGENNLRLVTLSNKDDLPCREGKKYENSDWKRYLREVQLAENENGKFAILDNNGNPVFNDWFDNVCLVTYQNHPCYPEHTKYGVVVMKDHKFACVKPNGAEKVTLRKFLINFLKPGKCELTHFDTKQYKFEYEDGDKIYQSFWGYERTWAIEQEKLMVKYDRNISYHENLMQNGNPYFSPARNVSDEEKEEWLNSYEPYYIFYRGVRKFYADNKKELEEFLAKYEKDKANGNLNEYNLHWEI